MKKHAFRFVAAFGTAAIALLPAIASAQYNGYNNGYNQGYNIQIYWGDNGNPYYYDQGHHRHYMSRDEERQWIARQDPDWYRQHRDEWRSDPQRFQNDWRSYGQDRGYWHREGDRDYRDRDNRDRDNRDRDNQDRH